MGPLQPKLQIYWFPRVQNGSNVSFSGCFKRLSECSGPVCPLHLFCRLALSRQHFNVRSYFIVCLRDKLFVCLGFVFVDSHSPHGRGTNIRPNAAEAARITLLSVPLRQDVHVLGLVIIRNLFKSDSIKSANMGDGTFTLQWYSTP